MKIQTFLVPANNLPGRGQYNGYIIVPKEHPWWGESWTDIWPDVHGGITFSDSVDYCIRKVKPMLDQTDVRLLLHQFPEGWVLGFDTAHAGDTDSYWTKQRVQDEAQKFADLARKETP